MSLKNLAPHQAVNQFFSLFMSNQFSASFEVFSKHSQQFFIAWTLKKLQEKHPAACEAAQLGEKEIRLMFKRNETQLVQTFWKHFYFTSGAGELYQFGWFDTSEVAGGTASVPVRLEYPNGQRGSVTLTAVKEGSVWKFGYIESGLDWV